MIKSVGQSVGSPVDLKKLREGGKASSANPAAGGESAVKGSVAASATPAARMASDGAPVDLDRVAAIKDAIASGNYPVDAQRIAERMIALDLGE